MTYIDRGACNMFKINILRFIRKYKIYKKVRFIMEYFFKELNHIIYDYLINYLNANKNISTSIYIYILNKNDKL